jgi:hypothetical protein
VNLPRAFWPNRQIRLLRYPEISSWNYVQTRYLGSDRSRPKVGQTVEVWACFPSAVLMAVDRNPSWPATSAMASEQNQVASSSTRPALRSAASKRAPDESRSVSLLAVSAFTHIPSSLLLLPSHDNNNWYFPSQGHDSDEDLMNYGISRGNWGKKKAKGSRWVRTGKLAAWGPGHEDWGVRVLDD